ncbi:AGAP011223-PA-like protein [Anopheles sinensis]|uniref:AGAP011223-PA-like protein n=1 Tax=Anopheles sinensis TaxID=74873 RepID=A0A084VTZ9_ANOSI|nr:AGAP011223-PA-like protein [Anopheles sinensis]
MGILKGSIVISLCCILIWSAEPASAKSDSVKKMLHQIKDSIRENDGKIVKCQLQIETVHADLKKLQDDSEWLKKTIQETLFWQKYLKEIMLELHEARKRGPFGSCGAEPSKVSGKYLIQLERSADEFEVYCEQSKFGGGWTVIQQRHNGRVNFFRNWFEYRRGFGSAGDEFWLGLDNLHKLTAHRPHELLVEVKDFQGNYRYARYTSFQIGSESEQFSLKLLGTYDGDAGDALRYNVGQNFSTPDRDNDPWKGVNCAADRHGAWWYKDCGPSNLNGRYQNTDDDLEAMYWSASHSDWSGMAYTRMMIRGRDE